jgi:hypothetical protein
MAKFNTGDRCLLDGKKEVVVVKPHNRSLTKYVVEILGQSVELVEQDRLTPNPSLQVTNSAE